MTSSEKLSPKYRRVSGNQDSENMVNNKNLTRLIGAATVIAYFNIAYCVALIGPTLLDLLQLVRSWEQLDLHLLLS